MSNQETKRQNALASRHEKLGASFDEWNGMDVALTYEQDLNLEHKAVRTTAGLFDVSALKKVFITGPDALEVCNHMCTRDLTKIYPGKSAYTVILNEKGCITDDGIMFHLSPNNWMLVHSSGASMEQLTKSAADKDVSIKFDDNLHDISLQGPKAVDFLNQYTPVNLPALPYFHQLATTLFGYDCLLSRTGYSGERGYEIFAKAEDIVHIWDNILEKGQPWGIIPCSFTCLDMIRVEANLLFFGYDMTEADTPWDLGIDFVVSKNKQADFRGKTALLAAKNQQKTTTFGIIADCDQAVDLDAGVYVGDKRIGKVTAPLYSTVMNKSLAMIRVDLEYAKSGIRVDIRGENVACQATTANVPLYDTNKGKRTEVTPVK